MHNDGFMRQPCGAGQPQHQCQSCQVRTENRKGSRTSGKEAFCRSAVRKSKWQNGWQTILPRPKMAKWWKFRKRRYLSAFPHFSTWQNGLWQSGKLFCHISTRLYNRRVNGKMKFPVMVCVAPGTPHSHPFNPLRWAFHGHRRYLRGTGVRAAQGVPPQNPQGMFLNG